MPLIINERIVEATKVTEIKTTISGKDFFMEDIYMFPANKNRESISIDNGLDRAIFVRINGGSGIRLSKGQGHKNSGTSDSSNGVCTIRLDRGE